MSGSSSPRRARTIPTRLAISTGSPTPNRRSFDRTVAMIRATAHAFGSTAKSRGGACAAFLAALAISSTASAFCRTTTSNVPADYDPAESGCWMQGDPLYWVTCQQSFNRANRWDQG